MSSDGADSDNELPSMEQVLFPHGRVPEAIACSSGDPNSSTSNFSKQQLFIIDLTEDAEHCSTCEKQLINNFINEDQYIYAFSNCGCALCANCSKRLDDNYCRSHKSHGRQTINRVFETQCQICSNGISSTRLFMPCGHVYCCQCLDEWHSTCSSDAEITPLKCPYCRRIYTKKNCKKFNARQLGLVRCR